MRRGRLLHYAIPLACEHAETGATQGLAFLRLAAGTHDDGAAMSICTAQQG